MPIHIGRREFIVTLSGAAAWPLSARAQQPDGVRRIGVLMAIAHDREGQERVAVFQEELQKLGWTEGRNVRIDYRWTGGDADRMRTYVTELVQAMPDVILANGSPIVAALRQETRTIPVVFAAVMDPLGPGLRCELGTSGEQHHRLH
jgi:putative ABC transport system substrate-binding protein